LEVRNAIESALEPFEERLRMIEEHRSRAEAIVRHDTTKGGLLEDKVNEVKDIVAWLKRRLEAVESDVEGKVGYARLLHYCCGFLVTILMMMPIIRTTNVENVIGDKIDDGVGGCDHCDNNAISDRDEDDDTNDEVITTEMTGK
jgi:hypothetical protein